LKKFFAILVTVMLIGVTATGCASKSTDNSSSSATKLSGSISASGSSALFPLVKDAKTKFQKINSGVSITVNAGGSGAGLTQVSGGTVDIGDSDVEASTKLDATAAATLVDHKICVIGVAAVVNSDVTVTNLTTQQLTDIFTGKTTNWKDVGGADEKITLVTRPTSSGTRAIFKQYAIGNQEEASNKALETDDSGTLAQNIVQTKGSIGYLALSYLTNASASINSVSIDGVAPTTDNIYNGTYKVWGYEHMYTKGAATGVVKAFLDYMQSSTYSDAMETLGYNLTSKMKTTH
jgi:phosphate transport system substrate-binding protein